MRPLLGLLATYAADFCFMVGTILNAVSTHLIGV